MLSAPHADDRPKPPRWAVLPEVTAGRLKDCVFLHFSQAGFIWLLTSHKVRYYKTAKKPYKMT